MKYIGIDQHKDFCQATVLDKDGKILDCKKIPECTPFRGHLV